MPGLIRMNQHSSQSHHRHTLVQLSFQCDRRKTEQGRWDSPCSIEGLPPPYTPGVLLTGLRLWHFSLHLHLPLIILAPRLVKWKLLKGRKTVRQWQENKTWGRRQKDEVFLRFLLLHYSPKISPMIPSPTATYPLIWISVLEITLSPTASVLMRVARLNTCAAMWGCSTTFCRRKGFSKPLCTKKNVKSVWKESWM